MKRSRIVPVVLMMALVGCGTEENGGGDSGTPPATTEPPATTTSPAPAEEGAQPPIESGDWRLDSITVSDNGLGDFGGRARITYTGDDPSGGSNVFTITVFVDGQVVASLMGSANEVPPGGTVTADLVSTDEFQPGPYAYDFQKDI